MKKITLVTMLLASFFTYSQSLPIDFETATSWVDFDGGAVTIITNPYNNGDNNSANVGKMVKSAGQVWGGSSLVLSLAIDFENNNTFKMKVYSPRVGAKVLLKVENSATTSINFEKEVSTTVADAWETLTFNYSAINTSNSYDKIVLIFDNGTQGDGSANFTFYIDDIALSNEVEEAEIALPIDFETETAWGDFDGGAVTTIANPYNNGDNNSANVGKMVKSAGQVWGGSSLVLSSAIDFENNNTFKMKVYSPRVGAKVLLKVENSGTPSINFEKEVSTTVADAWETLTFDYSAINASNSYDKIALIFDNGTQGDGSANYTFYIDDIKLIDEDSGGEPTEPMAAAPTPTHDAEDVISLFSDAYTDITVDTFRTDWSSGTLDDVEIAGNATKKYSSLNFVGIETVNNQVDASSMTHIHIDVWSPDFTSFGIKLVDFGPNAAYQGGDDVEHQLNFDEPNKGEWVSYNIALSEFTGLTNRANLAQYVLVGQPTGSATVYVDNIYFYNDGSLSTQRENLSDVSAFPNPVSSGLNLSSKDIVQNITIYNLLGKSIDYRVVNDKNVNIDVSFLSPGVYIIKYKTEQGVGSLKFIREK
ncbi:Por secretion system C-terminal sorting domain-containing protein [Tenacibaculum sp. MAR_2009_124]|uniref:T9SS type A sorting domain-containing protein n=1 Tax=Tenacibaculum sp. MAR_2009_124 TaxID=1250059 RepID=UPI00089CDFBD|nr:T9SS type A sorting domain-containing protein [Tenacibaculum sp. MAR_2009_124]SEC88206.1 Por secretion system C-terminal sorting domain-containing protein [Tenacibaculum sp. MAR_2009_124]